MASYEQLDRATHAGLEAVSGTRVPLVTVVRDSGFPSDVDALAATRDTEVHLAPGQSHHLHHELWHVVQQQAGRVPVTAQLGGVPLNTDRALESEADRKGPEIAAAAHRLRDIAVG